MTAPEVPRLDIQLLAAHVASIRSAASIGAYPEAAQEEYQLWEMVLDLIAEGSCRDPAAFALLVLTTRDIQFNRMSAKYTAPPLPPLPRELAW